MKASPLPICRLVLAFTAIAVAPTVTANQCGSVSPLLSQLGEQYYELASIPKSESHKRTIKPNNLIATLQSTPFKTGKGERTLCFGASILREQVKEFILESIETATVNSFNEMVLKAYEYDSDNRSARREIVFIPLSRAHISLDGENGFVTNTRHRQTINSRTNATSALAGTSHVREISIVATSSFRGVEINQSIFVNGRLAEWFTWHLAS